MQDLDFFASLFVAWHARTSLILPCFPSVALYQHVVRLLAEQHQDLIPHFTLAVASKHPNAIISATVLNRCCLGGGKGCLGKFVKRKVIGKSGVLN